MGAVVIGALAGIGVLVGTLGQNQKTGANGNDCTGYRGAHCGATQ